MIDNQVSFKDSQIYKNSHGDTRLRNIKVIAAVFALIAMVSVLVILSLNELERNSYPKPSYIKDSKR